MVLLLEYNIFVLFPPLLPVYKWWWITDSLFHQSWTQFHTFRFLFFPFFIPVHKQWPQKLFEHLSHNSKCIYLCIGQKIPKQVLFYLFVLFCLWIACFKAKYLTKKVITLFMSFFLVFLGQNVLKQNIWFFFFIITFFLCLLDKTS